MQIRLARPEDGFKIIQLYQEVYGPGYPDSAMREYVAFKACLDDPQVYWFIAHEAEELVGSLVARHDPAHLLAKVGGGAVHPRWQGKRVLTEVMGAALEHLRTKTSGVDVVYATTRSVHEAAQNLVDHFGFKKLGIFPNTHRTGEDYETHSLAAWFSAEGFSKRFTGYKMHADLMGLYELARTEIPDMRLPDETVVPEAPTRALSDPPPLEIIQAPRFVAHRYQQLHESGGMQFDFFPFHRPNLLLLSPDQSVEIFCQFNPDGHCVLIGGKVGPDTSYTQLLTRATRQLRDHGARYIEMVVRADKPKIIDSILRARMIPSAFFPALQLKDGQRWDFFVFSRSFEILDFQNVKLKGLNQRYLEEYFKAWKKISLNPKMLDV